MTHWRLDEKDKARERFDRVAASMDKHSIDHPEAVALRAEAARLLGKEEK